MHFKTIVKTYGNGPPADPPPQHMEISICFVVFFFESFPNPFATKNYKSYYLNKLKVWNESDLANKFYYIIFLPYIIAISDTRSCYICNYEQEI